jgi:hypothetical protein
VTNDMKLGLLAGVAGVLAVAVVYFPKGPAATAAPSVAVAGGSAAAPPGVPPAAVVVPPGKAEPAGSLTHR